MTRASDLDGAFRDLARALADLPARRWQAGGDRTDVRRALRESFGTGGTVLSVPGRSRQRSAMRALLLVDVSRSVLDTVDRGFLIDVLRHARRRWRDARAFLFDETLREVTDAVDAPSAQVAIDALEAAEAEWGGGTRIGASLARLRETAPEAVDRRTTVFVVSDGLEMGEVSVLEREVAWLARRAERVLWLNPLATAAEYEPTARGMAAALPYLDGLFAFAGPDDVREAARQLRQQGPGGRVGYQFDARRGRPRP
ncbi:MAG: VWA domain-containing protein [Haloarculaceae archaeon]